MPHDSPGTDTKVHGEIRTGSPPTGATNAGGVGKNWPLSTKNLLKLDNGTR